VRFRLGFAHTAPADAVRVVGDVEALGSWSRAAPEPVIEDNDPNAPWSRAVELPANAPVQYKYQIVSPSPAGPLFEADQLAASRNRELVTFVACGAERVRDDGAFLFPVTAL
jgi:hypothetical protein